MRENLVTDGRFRESSITYGKSETIPIMGKADAKYHTVGEDVEISVTPINEIVITIDQTLYAATRVADIDEAMRNDIKRSDLANELGKALAKSKDQHILQLVALAARAASPVTGEPGGSKITNADLATDTTGEVLVETIKQAAQTFDEKNVPEENRMVFLPPKYYWQLAGNTKIMNRDWGGQGVYAEGKVIRVFGMEVIKTNNTSFGTVVDSGSVAGGGTSNKYAGDFTNTVGVAATRDAVGTVTLKGLLTEQERQLGKLGTLIVAHMLLGHGTVRPACSIELAKA